MVHVIYIAGPIGSRDLWTREQNIRRAEALSLEVLRLGAMGLNTHAMGRFFFGAIEEETVMQGCLELVRRSDAVLVTPDWETSKGARREVALARELDLPIYYTIEELATALNRPVAP